MVVTNIAGSTAAVRVSVFAISPGIFAAVNRGTYVEIYATGLGPVSGGLTVNQPRVLIGLTEAQILYSGLAPGLPGVYQVNAQAPGGGPTVTLQIGGKQSNLVLVL